MTAIAMIFGMFQHMGFENLLAIRQFDKLLLGIKLRLK